MVHQVSQQGRLAHFCKALSDFRSRRASDADDEWTLESISRTSFWSLREAWRHSLVFHLLFEVVYISALATFVVGSVCFLPEFEEWVALGCDLFFIGSVILAALSGYEVLEEVLIILGLGVHVEELPTFGHDHEDTRCCGAYPKQWEMMLEKMMYFIGSVVFAVGTAFWKHPHLVAAEVAGDQTTMEVYVWATEMFIGGSAIFALAAFVNALSLHQTHPTFTSWAMATCSSYELGGILFVMGSVCFLPNMGCEADMLALGAWCFITGSVMYVLGALIGLLRTWALFQLEDQQEDDMELMRQVGSNTTASDADSAGSGRPGGNGDLRHRNPAETPHAPHRPALPRSASLLGTKKQGMPRRDSGLLGTLVKGSGSPRRAAPG